MRIDSNERKVCEAIARSFEARMDCLRHSAFFPEEDRTGAPVDYVFNLGQQQFALEHTIVEPFEEYTRMAAESDHFIRPLKDAVEGHLPSPGVYYLDVPADPTAKLHRRAHSQVQAQIAAWAIEQAEAMHREYPTKPDRFRQPRGREQREETCIANIRVVLRRQLHWSVASRFDGRVFVGRYAPANYEELRAHRIQRALRKKVAQLEPYRQDRAKIVLALENRDLFLSNHMIVGNLAIKLMKSQDLHFDEVLFVDTTIDTKWTLVSIFRDGIAWPDDETDHRYVEVNPLTL